MSSSSGSSQSTSEPTFLETPENALIDQLSQYAQGLAKQMDSWASQEFAHTSAITNQAVGNFFNVSQQMVGLSNKLTDQYNNITSADYQQLHDEANSFASPGRMAVDMGQAGATQAQAGDQARNNSEEALRSYGIDPSAGRYAALDKAAAVQNAANVAGAENMQRNADIATGQRLRSESLQFGATLPSSIANINNTAIQANAGASNAVLANANTGANLKSLADKYLQTAMGIKLPLSGQKSQSTSSNMSSSPQQPHGGNGGNGDGSGRGGTGHGDGSGGPAWMPDHSGAGQTGFTSGGRMGGGPGPKSLDVPGGGSGEDPFGGGDDPYNTGGWGGDPYTGGNADSDNAGGLGGDGWGGDPYTSGGSDYGSMDDGGYNSGGWGGDPYSGGGDYGGGGSDYNTGGWGGDPYSGGGDYGGGYGDYTAPSDDYDMGGAYAAGGAIPDGGIIQQRVPPKPMGPTTGGMVPNQASPSMGQRTDDVPANLNAGEFVIPRDVAMWKGQEFFQNLITQSRHKRVTAPAHGKPPKPGNNPVASKKPTFSSQPMR